MYKVHGLRLSEEARREQLIRTGRDPGASVNLELDLTAWSEEERRQVLEVLGIDPSTTLYGLEWASPIYPEGKEDWLGIVLPGIREAFEAKRLKDFQQGLSRMRELREKDDVEVYQALRWGDYAPKVTWKDFPDYQEALALWEELQVRAERGRLQKEAEEARLRAEAARQKAEAKAKEEARQQRRREWIEAHGSEDLRRCARLGYGCTPLFEEEYVQSLIPGAVVDHYDRARWEEVDTPSPEGLRRLEELLGLQESHGARLKLVHLTQLPRGYREDEEAWHTRDAFLEKREAILVDLEEVEHFAYLLV